MEESHSTDGSFGMDVSLLKIAPLNSGNKFIWSNDFEILLIGKGFWKYVDENSPPVSVRADQNSCDRKSDLALETILITIDASCEASVINLCNPREVWKKLKNTFRQVSEATIETKPTILHQIKLQPGENIFGYSNKI